MTNITSSADELAHFITNIVNENDRLKQLNGILTKQHQELNEELIALREKIADSKPTDDVAQFKYLCKIYSVNQNAKNVVHKLNELVQKIFEDSLGKNVTSLYNMSNDEFRQLCDNFSGKLRVDSRDILYKRYDIIETILNGNDDLIKDVIKMLTKYNKEKNKMYPLAQYKYIEG